MSFSFIELLRVSMERDYCWKSRRDFQFYRIASPQKVYFWELINHRSGEGNSCGLTSQM